MDAAKTISALRRADEAHLHKTAMTAIHPAAHLTATLAFVVAVLAHGRYDFSGLVPFMLYPAAIMLLGDIPFGLIAPRVAVALPFAALVGAAGLLFTADKSAAWLVFFVICAKCIICAAAALLLVCVCGMGGITLALNFFKLPRLLVAQLSFTYRYLFVLGEEIISVICAHSLRSHGRGVSLKRFGSVCGGLFLRSLKRADAVYAAMLCRGFTGTMPSSKSKPFSRTDAAWLSCWLVFFIICACFNLPALLGNIIVN